MSYLYQYNTSDSVEEQARKSELRHQQIDAQYPHTGVTQADVAHAEHLVRMAQIRAGH